MPGQCLFLSAQIISDYQPSYRCVEQLSRRTSAYAPENIIAGMRTALKDGVINILYLWRDVHICCVITWQALFLLA